MSTENIDKFIELFTKQDDIKVLDSKFIEGLDKIKDQISKFSETQKAFLDIQIQKLRASGCDEIFQEKVSGVKEDRKELNSLIGKLRAGDTVCVVRLDRLCRRMLRLVALINDFKEKHINILKSIVPNSKIMMVDGEIFSWYGSRLLHLKKYVIGLKKRLYA